MDTARNKYTQELVEAEELWNIETVDSDAYTCRGCSIQVFPASYDKARNKKRPYFSLGPVNEHKADCDVDGEAKAIKRAQKERLGTPEGFPVPFPSKLTLTDERPSEKSGADSPGDPAGGQGRSRSVGVGPTPKRHHGHTVKTIRPACRAFINFPNDRDSLPLDIPGVPGKTYAKVFWYIASKSPEPFQTPVHLYYAPIRWKADPVVADTHCELTLNSGEWDAAKNSFKSLYRIKVNWQNWSQSRRDSLLREFNATREEAIEQSKKDNQIKGWVFFVGTQDANDPSIMHVDNYRFVCCLAAKIVWPKK